MISSTPPQRALDNADCLYNEAEVQQAFACMAEQITALVSHRDPLFFCVMNGGLIVSGQLLPRLQFPLQCEYLHATRYGHEATGKQLRWLVKPSICVKGRTVLIVDDIFDEGRTVFEIVAYFKAAGAEKVFIVVLVDKQHDRKVLDLKPDIVGLKADDRFLFGYGMDYQGYWRNANGIYALQQS